MTGRAVDLAGVRPGDELSLNLFTSDGADMVTKETVVTGTAFDSIEVAADASQDRSAVYLTPAFTQANAVRLQAWSSSRLILEPSASLDVDVLPQLRDVGGRLTRRSPHRSREFRRPFARSTPHWVCSAC